jgi:predicted TIM-barrel fold metal-dependent hydrolase
VKVWKNVGMELRDPETGGWVLCDDGRFDPIYEHLAGRGVAVLMHIGEPLACWTSLAEMERQGSPHLGYYRNNPQWHWHGRADVPSHAQLMAARDRVMEKHPSLTVVGAHYGSHEYDLAEVAERFDRYPNYRVDTSGRLGDLALRTAEDRDGVRDFHRRYADRILWGIDWVMSQPLSGRPKVVDALLDRYDRERRFYETGETLDFGGSTVRGLDLSDDVLAAVRCETATKTYGVFKD